MYEYTRKENRYISFDTPTGGYNQLTLDYKDVVLYIKEEIDKKFIIIIVFSKETTHFEKIISNVELKSIEFIPNMDTYVLKDDILTTSNDSSLSID